MSDKEYVFKPNISLSTDGFEVPSMLRINVSPSEAEDYLELKKIPDDVFHEMVRDWVDAVYKVAGKQKPDGAER